MTRTTKLYYEAHITIDPVFGSFREQVRLVAEAYHFRLANLVLRKSETEEQPYMDDTFLTGHSTDFTDITVRVIALISALHANDIFVRRYKIEDTLIDSRHGDDLNLLAESGDT